MHVTELRQSVLKAYSRSRELESCKAKQARKRSVLLYMSIPSLFLTPQGRRAADREQVLIDADKTARLMLPESRIEAALGDQLTVAAGFDDLPLINHH